MPNRLDTENLSLANDMLPDLHHVLLVCQAIFFKTVVRWDEKVDPRSQMALSYRDPRTQECNHVDKEIDP
jgi:hypothetical protein